MKKTLMTIGSLFLCLCLGGCVSYESKGSAKTATPKSTVIATSMAVLDICEKLDLNVIGIPKSSVRDVSSKYQDVKTVGSPMSPDMEIISSLKADWILAPVSLRTDLEPKFKKTGSEYAFLNLSSLEGMYQSIEELGELFGREKEAKKLIDDYEQFAKQYKDKNKDKKKKKVLILMGFPGSYVAATPNSYIGNLVKLAGGENVYTDDSKDFISVNTEDMLKKDPDIILRASHASPDEVKKMFAEEFKTNDIWKHFDAVKKDKVYDLDSNLFGMSAEFTYKKAWKQLDNILYGDDK